MLNQETFGKPKIAAPGEAHLACVLLLDTSSSMEGEPIKSLNRALAEFKEKVLMHEMAKKTLDVAIVEFNSEAHVVQDFTPLLHMEPVTLEAKGTTSMGAGINMAIDMVKERNRIYDELGTPVLKPWIFMITDGFPTDSIDEAARRIHEEESKGSRGKLKFWALGVSDYDKETLFKLTDRVMELINTDFAGIFNWVGESMTAISVSRVGEEDDVELPLLPENARVVPKNW